MHIVRYTLLLLLAMILQAAWPNSFDLYGFRPDLIMIIALFAGLRHGVVFGMFLGATGGFFQDIYSPPDLGLNTFLKSTVGFSIGYIRKRISYDNNIVIATLLFIVSLLHDLTFYLGSTAITLEDIPVFMLRYGVGRAVFTTLLGLFFAIGLTLRNRILSD